MEYFPFFSRDLLENEVKGFSNVDIYQEMFPLWTYARFPLLFLTGICSELDVVAGQGVLLVGALCGFATAPRNSTA